MTSSTQIFAPAGSVFTESVPGAAVAEAVVPGVCAMNSFILPTHQVNALLMGPGGYTQKDYLKAGSIMSVLFIGIAVILIYLLIR
jgi:di/tricarboxylate transporter